MMDDVVEVTTEGNSLIKAVYHSRLRLTRLLLEGGAYINESNDRGETPLMIACKTKHVDQQSVSKVKMIKYLLENKADPNIQDKHGKTALMHACLEKSGPEVISLLLNSGADLSLQDHSGCSALVYAVNAEDKETLKVLLSACKARGKEVIIIRMDKSPSGRQTTKQYLNVPPSPDIEECHSPCSCTSPSEIELKSSPSPLSDTLSAEKELFNFKDPDPVDGYKGSSQPGSPTRRTHLVNVAAKLPQLQRLHSEPWLKIPSALLHQHKQQSSLPEELQDITPEEELSLKMNALASSKRYFTRHQSIDVKDTAHLLKAFDQAGPRKLSCDEIHSHSLYSEGGHNRSEIPVDQDPDSVHSISVSSLRSIVQRRNLGANHYSSDSQLTRCIGPAVAEDSKSLLEKKKLFSQAAVLSGSRDSMESIPQSSVSRRIPSGLERRGSGALLLDHIAQTRPGFLPPLNVNPHPPIPDINAHKMSGIIASGSKPFVPTAPSFPKEFKNKKMLLRRHSMHTEQIKQLVNFEEILS
ncbi:ankyrin repeat domain-containing protein 34B isoform X2 [Rhinatrema bivittatum]|uniref:ankyrin repeat domain-containing protein 34B isoform X2 n=1 Tax=Rhinatrema bivittatum TaxID=194408 RepID=UPI001129B09F|nr:ankyrin repeat domain-containing protein 34B isoform X2 [Rhinatrema bivittatum]